jgi:2-polyprenyl-3-methyl-5-hydroxy-6-metoxy-1,4-benzoquinol methylase
MSEMSRQPLDPFSEVMKRDWDARAREDAKWYVNTTRRDQTEAEFDASGAREMDVLVLPELALLADGRDPRGLRLLEIGCGAGRMTKHLARLFGEVHSTDVSGEMIRQARVRLRDCRNVFFYETSGVDFAALPNDRFDAVFSAYVFQHVPDKAVIISNIRDAWRVTSPGGILKLHTNGAESAEYDALEKDTWAGATFSEREIRELARGLGAQLVSIYGAGTGYCWMTLRKPAAGSGRRKTQPRIEYVARADNASIRSIPNSGDDAWLSLLAVGLDRDGVDANSLSVEIGGQPVAPRYVGRVRPHFEAEVRRRLETPPDQLVYIEAGVPTGMAAGPAPAAIRLMSGEASPPVDVALSEPSVTAPFIFTVRNAHDHGTDIHAAGPKSRMLLSAVGLDDTATCENVRVRVGDRDIMPVSVGFVVEIADYRVEAQLPEGIEPGITTLQLRFGGTASAPIELEIQSPGAPRK